MNLLFKNKSLTPYIKNIYKLIKIYIIHHFIKNKPLIVISLTEHIGDIVACEPVSYYLKTKNPKAFIIWVINGKYKELVAANPNIDKILTVTSVGEWILIKNAIKKFINIFDLHLNGKPCSIYNLVVKNNNAHNISVYNYFFYGNILSSFSLNANLEIPDIQPRFHLKHNINIGFFLPKHYITIHTRSNEDSKCWSNEKWNSLTEKILIAYPDLYIIEIGLDKVISIDSKRYINYTSKLSLQENAFVIKNAFFYIGIDSGFAHFANAYKINSAILIGYYRDFKNYMPYSGYFNATKDESIIYHNDVLKEMPVEPAFLKIKTRIDDLFIASNND